MTKDELFSELRKQKALIVHCSRTGKGDAQASESLFPDDLKQATEVCSKGKELSCSVIWPDHIKTFGAIGIILRPRSISSVSSVCHEDAGSSYDQETGKRTSSGPPLSIDTVAETFAKSKNYNEWCVGDADTLGIFVHPKQGWLVSKRVKLSEVPGADSSILDQECVVPVHVTYEEIVSAFPEHNIYSFKNGEIVRVGLVAGRCQCVETHPDEIYPERQ